VALCALAQSDNPHVVFLAGDFTIGETDGMRDGVAVVRQVFERLRRTPSRAWKKVLGLVYSIEIARSRTGKWWVHAHTLLAVDRRDQPSTRKSLPRAWARIARALRWPEEPFDPRSGSDDRFNALMEHQKVKPFHAYKQDGRAGHVVQVLSIDELEADLRGRARYLRERNGEPGHEPFLARTRLTEDDRLAILRARFRLNGRAGIFKRHGKDEVKALADGYRQIRFQDPSIRRQRDHPPRAPAPHMSSRRRVPPSSRTFRDRLRRRFSPSSTKWLSTRTARPPTADVTAKREDERRHVVYF
jgi:hypothetical protein